MNAATIDVRARRIVALAVAVAVHVVLVSLLLLSLSRPRESSPEPTAEIAPIGLPPPGPRQGGETHAEEPQRSSPPQLRTPLQPTPSPPPPPAAPTGSTAAASAEADAPTSGSAVSDRWRVLYDPHAHGRYGIAFGCDPAELPLLTAVQRAYCRRPPDGETRKPPSWGRAAAPGP